MCLRTGFASCEHVDMCLRPGLSSCGHVTTSSSQEAFHVHMTTSSHAPMPNILRERTLEQTQVHG